MEGREAKYMLYPGGSEEPIAYVIFRIDVETAAR